MSTVLVTQEIFNNMSFDAKTEKNVSALRAIVKIIVFKLQF